MVKLFRMKNTRKIFSVPVISNKKKNIHRSTFAHHTSTPLAFLYKKKKSGCKIFRSKTERLSQERTFSKPYFEGLRVILRVGIGDCTTPYHTRARS